MRQSKQKIRERYANMPHSDWFREAYEGRSVDGKKVAKQPVSAGERKDRPVIDNSMTSSQEHCHLCGELKRCHVQRSEFYGRTWKHACCEECQ